MLKLILNAVNSGIDNVTLIKINEKISPYQIQSRVSVLSRHIENVNLWINSFQRMVPYTIQPNNSISNSNLLFREGFQKKRVYYYDFCHFASAFFSFATESYIYETDFTLSLSLKYPLKPSYNWFKIDILRLLRTLTGDCHIIIQPCLWSPQLLYINDIQLKLCSIRVLEVRK